MEPINVYMKKTHLVIFVITTAIFIIMGAILTLFGLFEEGETVAFITGILLLVLFGSLFLYFLKKIRKPKPAVIISIDGIYDNATSVGAGLVRWEDIKSLKISRLTGQLYLCITTKDPDFVTKQMSGIKGFINRLNNKMTKAQVNIPLNNLKYDSNQLYKEIEKMWRRSKMKKEA